MAVVYSVVAYPLFPPAFPPTRHVTYTTEFCTNISDSLRNINESANDAYEQLKALLVTGYTKAPWTRAFELLKYPELGDMKPPNLM
jgi:hypothetical protein